MYMLYVTTGKFDAVCKIRQKPNTMAAADVFWDAGIAGGCNHLQKLLWPFDSGVRTQAALYGFLKNNCGT